MRANQAMKTMYLKVHTVQGSILEALEDLGQSDPAWSSLARPENVERMKALMNKIDTILKDDFAAAFIRTDLAELKKEFNGKQTDKKITDFWFKLRSLHDPLTEAVKQLDAEQQRLLRMYRAGKR